VAGLAGTVIERTHTGIDPEKHAKSIDCRAHGKAGD